MKEVEFRGEDVGIKFVRKFYPYYVNGFPGASKCRGELVLMDNIKEINSLLDKILCLAQNTAGGSRIEPPALLMLIDI